MPSSDTKRIWITNAMRKQAQSLPADNPYWKTLERIESLKESAGMKHVLACWALSAALDGGRIADKQLLKRKSSQLSHAASQVLADDLGRFRISSLIAIICAVLCCTFLRSVMLDQYLINFSVDALVAALAAAGMFVNLGVSLKTVRIYGKTREFILADILALVLWYLIFLLMPQFDTSLVIFLLAYLLERRKFKVMLEKFASDNGIVLSPGLK